MAAADHATTWTAPDRTYRVLFSTGHTMDVTTCLGDGSGLRSFALEEAVRAWGKMKGADWKIEGVAWLPTQLPPIEGQLTLPAG